MHELRDVDREKVESFANVVKVVVNNESDGDHVQSLFITYGDVMKWNGEVVWPSGEPDESDVKTALRLAEEHLSPTMQTTISIHVGRKLPEIDDESLLRY